jgi:peptidoglycan/xylan/chitin deacetylase (PgdA/CDA1 family)
MTTRITLLRDVPSEPAGGTWKYGDTKTATDSYAQYLIEAGAAYAYDAPQRVDALWSDPTGAALVRPDNTRVLTSRTRRAAPRALSYSGGSYLYLAGTVDAVASDVFGTQQHYRMTTGTASGDTAQFRYRWTSGNPSLSAIGGIVLPIRVEQVGSAASSELLLTISNTVSAGTANVNQLQYLHLGRTGDQFVYFPLDKFTANGAPTQVPVDANLYDFNLTLTNRSAGTATIAVLGTPQLSCGVRPTISLGFDDGLLSQYTEAYPLMSNAGLVGNLWVSPDYVDQPGYMTRAQVTELHKAGWMIGVHGNVSHTSGGITSRDILLAEVRRNLDYVAANWPGEGQRHYVYIGGAVNASWSLSVLQELGFVTARLVTRGHPMGVGVGVTPASWLLMPSSAVLDATVAAQQTNIADCITGLWPMMEMHFHSINPVSPESAVETTSRANAKTLIELVRDKVALGVLDCVTRDDMYRRFATAY